MTPAAAEWVYDVVITRRYKEATGAIMWTGKGADRRDEGHGAAFLQACRCQYGLCGRCGDGRPELCAHRGWTPPAGPDDWMQNGRGHAIAAVWRSGKPCAWLCPSVRLGQLELFALAGGAQ